MSLRVSRTIEKLVKLFPGRTALKLTTRITHRPVAFLLIVAIFFSGALITLPKNVKAVGSQNKPVISTLPEPFVIHAPATESILIPATVKFFSNLASYFKLPSSPEGLTAVRTGADPAAFSTKSGQELLEPYLPAGTTTFDFDGDGKADIARSHSANTDYKIQNSNNLSNTIYTFTGLSGARHAEADYDGDTKTDPAFFAGGMWTIRKSGTGTIQTISNFGQSGDVPVPGHYLGQATVDVALYRPSTAVWYFCNGLSCGSWTSTTFGTPGDIPVVGDYDGDGITDIALFRPVTGDWHVNGSSTGYFTIHWGIATDVPVPADYNGDGKTDIAVFRPSTGTWYRLLSPNFSSYTYSNWGNWTDQPVPADYDGDGKADLAIWRPTTGEWWLSHSSDSNWDVGNLGEHGDFAIPSAYVKQVGGDATPDELAQARLDPKNSTGETNLYSRNFSWSSGLISLPGRAGLDLNLGISYNSLVWTKIGDSMYFDPDWSNITPGFHFGLPTIEPVHYDGIKQKFAFMMVTPSGGRLEFRQTAVSNVYETSDSGYTQLVVSNVSTDPNAQVDTQTIVVTSTDGTGMKYVWIDGAFRCTQIKDRNGNIISATYLLDGRLNTLTDTLGRVLTVNYNTDNLPSSIIQDWFDDNGKGSSTHTHTWATFTYTDITTDTSFGSLSIVGPPNGVSIKALQKITYPDYSFTKFIYNNYAQVTQVENYAPDQHKLNYTKTNLASVSGGQSDCPRFTHTYTWAENFNLGQESDTENTAPISDSFTGPNGSESTKMVRVTLANHPNNLSNKLHFGVSGWKEGLQIATEDCISVGCTGTDRKRWTWTNWTQDNTSLSYILNPRVIESRVGDGTNTKRTTIEYYQPTTGVFPYGLPETVKIYDSDLSTVIKKSVTAYNVSSSYTDLRIIGLPSQSENWGWNDQTHTLEYVSKVTFGYDESGSLQSVSPTQHDDDHFGIGFSYRGNLTSKTRWDVSSLSAAVTSSIQYNTAGSPISQTDPRGRIVRIGYADAWNDGTARTTYAYPTVFTDPNSSTLGEMSHSSFVKYRYDFGATVQAESPPPAGSNFGKQTRHVYNDTTGRPERDSIYKNNGVTWGEYSYTRYSLPTPYDNGVQVFQSTTISDTNANGYGDSADEVTTESLFDGAGNLRMSRVPHTFNSNGTTASWAATITEYDILGRVANQSVPTEVDSSWNPTGDDALFLWTHQKYDWKGRVIRKINTDGFDSSTLNDSDILISYDGCGCAGGQVTTIQSERVPIPDTSNFARRQQKVYEDVLGRPYQSETFLWNGTDVYKRSQTQFNGRNQAISVTQTDVPNSTAQVTTISYDGYGRMATEQDPQQSVGTGKTYTYNEDDSIKTVTDARGAITHYKYGNFDDSTSAEKRPLVTRMKWTVPTESPIERPSDVAFLYDSIGNRTSMTDGLGTQTYSYDWLSQLTSETRQFNEALSQAPQDNNSFRIEYTYTISGLLESLKEPWGTTVNYVADRIGRLTSVTPSSPFGGVSEFAVNAQYRAWGGFKHLEYANGVSMNTTFDNRLHPSTFQLSTSGTTVMNKTYDYYSDGNLKHVDDAVNGDFDRLTTYDHQGRVYQAKSSNEANGGTVTQPLLHLPFHQTYTFNAFGDLAARTNLFWGVDKDFSFTFANHRISGWTYDADGRVTQSFYPDQLANFEYDAAGQLILKHDHPSPDIQEDKFHSYRDGLGQQLKRQTDRCRLIYVDPEPPPEHCSWSAPDEISYYIRSTVLSGEVVAEAGSSGERGRRYIYGWGERIAELTTRFTYNPSQTIDAVQYYHTDPQKVSQRVTRSSPEPLLGNPSWDPSYIDPRHAELDGIGANVGLVTNYTYSPGPPEGAPIPLESDAVALVNRLFIPITVNGSSTSIQALRSWDVAGILDVAPSAKNRDLASRIGHWEEWDGPSGTHGVDANGEPIEFSTVETQFVFDDLGPPLISRRSTRYIAGTVQYFLETNPDCENLYNKILKQLAKDNNVMLDGDIYHYVQEFGKNGTLFARTHTPTAGISNTNGNANQVDYGTRGWGMYLDVSSNHGSKTFEDFATTFLGELVHAIGHRGGKSLFSDAAGAAANNHLGIGISLEEYMNLPSEQPYIKIDGNGNRYLDGGASFLFHGVISETCSKLPGTPKFQGMR